MFRECYLDAQLQCFSWVHLEKMRDQFKNPKVTHVLIHVVYLKFGKHAEKVIITIISIITKC